MIEHEHAVQGLGDAQAEGPESEEQHRPEEVPVPEGLDQAGEAVPFVAPVCLVAVGVGGSTQPDITEPAEDRAHGEDDVEPNLLARRPEIVDESADGESGDHGHEGADDGLAAREPASYVAGHGTGHPGVVEGGEGVAAQQAESDEHHERRQLHGRREEQGNQGWGAPQGDLHHAHGDDDALPPQVPSQDGHEKLHGGQQVGHEGEEGDVGGIGAEVEGVAREHGGADPHGLAPDPPEAAGGYERLPGPGRLTARQAPGAAAGTFHHARLRCPVAAGVEAERGSSPWG